MTVLQMGETEISMEREQFKMTIYWQLDGDLKWKHGNSLWITLHVQKLSAVFFFFALVTG